MFITENVCKSQNDPASLQSFIGDVAQLARALAWHARGRGFESHLLHKTRLDASLSGFFDFATTVAILHGGWLARGRGATGAAFRKGV